MKINKVELKNYRIHKDYSQTFDKGINLLLGNNGSGKTSVLEAIGFALFRADPRGNIEDIISKGQKTGYVKLNFTGNDEKEYEIERKFGGSPSIKLTSLDSCQTWTGSDQAYNQISKIFEIDINPGIFFESVICAKQNQFIDIFLQRQSEREKLFNLLFETDIYKTLEQKILEQNEKKYKADKNNKEIEKNTLKAEQKDIIVLKEVLEKLEESLKKEKTNQENTENDLSAQNSKLKECLNLKEQIEKKETEINYSNNSIKTLEENKIIANKDFIASEESKTFLEKNKDVYEKYTDAKTKSNLLEKEFQQYSNAIKAYEKLTVEKQKIKEQVLKSSNEKDIKENDLKTIAEKIIKAEEDLTREKEKSDAIISEKTIKENEIHNFKEQLDILLPVKAKLEELAKNKSLNDIEEKRILKEQETLKNNIIPVETIIKEEEQLKKDKESTESLKKDLASVNTGIAEMKRAEKELSSGNCPILNCPCMNMSENSEYFNKRLNTLLEQEKKTRELLNNYSDLDKREMNFNEKRIARENNCNNFNNNIKLLENCKIKKNQFEAEENIQITKSGLSSFEELLNSIENIKSSAIKTGRDIENLASKITESKKQTENINKELTRLIKSKEGCLIEINEINKAIIEYKNKLLELEPKITAAKTDTEKAEKLQTEINTIKTNILNPLQGDYDKCLENTKPASEYEERKNRLAAFIKNIQDENEKVKTFQEELQQLRTNFSLEQLEFHEKNVKELTAKKDELLVKITGINKDIVQANKEIENYKKKEKDILQLNSAIDTLQQKINLTEIFRDNLKDLGRIVAEKRAQRIAFIAGDYFNRITNRGESVIWNCSEKEKYCLYLKNNDYLCNFENLSGGEQICLAIAVRLALSEEFGNTGFIILDEPTNNMDQSKRQLLSENLPKMAQYLKQAFVVTHDDTFRNSAAKVIEFNEAV